MKFTIYNLQFTKVGKRGLPRREQVSVVRGQSLFEVILALAVISIIIVGVVLLAAVSIKNSSFSRNKALAGRFAQEGVEWLRGERDSSWSTFSAKAQTPTWCLPSLSWASAKSGVCGSGDAIPGTPLKREIGLTMVDVSTIQTQVKVYWSDTQGFHEANLVTTLTNWRAQ